MAGNLGKSYGAYSGPTLEDCVKLWTTIKRDLVSDAAIEVRLPILPLGQDRPKVIVNSPGLGPLTGAERPHVWATMELANGSVAFTYTNLHLMLSRAYHNMEAFLGGQMVISDAAPWE